MNMIQICLDTMPSATHDSLYNLADSLSANHSKITLEAINIALSSTRVNSILTAISILLTLVSGFFLWRTKCIENRLIKKLSRDQIMIYADDFHEMININGTKLRNITISPGRPNKHLESVHTLLNDYSKIRNRVSASRKEDLNKSVEISLGLIVDAEAGNKDGLAELISSLTAIDRALQDEVDELQTGKKSKFKTKACTFFMYGKTDVEQLCE